MVVHMRADRPEPPSALVRSHRQRLVQRFRLAGDVERVHAHDPVSELLVRPGVLREHDHTVALVHQRRFLRDEVQPVEDRVHEQDVELLVRGDRGDEVVLDHELDGRPAVLLEPVVDTPRLALDRAQVLGVLRDVLPRGVEQGKHPDPADCLRMRIEVELERAEASDDVLGRIGAVDA